MIVSSCTTSSFTVSTVTLFATAVPLNRYTDAVVSNGFCVSTNFQPSRIGCSMTRTLSLFVLLLAAYSCDATSLRLMVSSPLSILAVRTEPGLRVLRIVDQHFEIDAVAEQPLMTRRHVVDARVAGVAAVVEHRERPLQQMLPGRVLE